MALVRVKRRAQEDPVDVLLVACKKLKSSDNNEVDCAEIEEKSTLFKFTATVPSEKPEELRSHLSRILSTDSKQQLRRRKNDVDTLLEKIRADQKSVSKSNRFKVVNCFRAVDTDFYSEDETSPQHQGKTLAIVDIESTASPTSVAAIHEGPKDSDNSEESKSEQYVYDLYYSKVGDFDDLVFEKMLSVHEVDENLLFDCGTDEEDRSVEDEDDSNDENNWRNDYPDEDPDGDDDDDRSSRSSISEEQMRLAARLSNVNIDGCYSSDLSSDREEEGLIYGSYADYDRYNAWVASDDDLDV